MRDFSRNSWSAVWELYKRFWFYGGEDTEIIFVNARQNKGRPTYRRTLWQWMRFGSLNQPHLNVATRTSAPRFLSRDKGTEVIVLNWSISQRKIEWQKKKKKKWMDKKTRTWRLFFLSKKNRHFYQLSIIIFYGGTFLCFHLLPIVEAVVNIFILSFCVLKLSCKGSCYINV